jgi:hypothetical protein
MQGNFSKVTNAFDIISTPKPNIMVKVNVSNPAHKLLLDIQLSLLFIVTAEQLLGQILPKLLHDLFKLGVQLSFNVVDEEQS